MSVNNGREFELAVHKWVEAGVSDGTLGLLPQNARVHSQYPLYSRDRESSIIFDVVVQVFRTSATEPYLTWIWECKDYRHPVPVDDIEEFDSKLAQVGRNRTKGTVVSSSGFQRGAIRLAKSSGIGLVRIPVSASADGVFLDLGSMRNVAEVAPSSFGALRLPFMALDLARKGYRNLLTVQTRAQAEGADSFRFLSGEASSGSPYVLQDSMGRLFRCESMRDLLKAAAGESLGEGT